MPKTAKARKKSAPTAHPDEARLRDEKRLLQRVTRLAADVRVWTRKTTRAIYAADRAAREFVAFIQERDGELSAGPRDGEASTR